MWPAARSVGLLRTARFERGSRDQRAGVRDPGARALMNRAESISPADRRPPARESGAGAEVRTRTGLPPAVFKTAASACSATPATGIVPADGFGAATPRHPHA